MTTDFSSLLNVGSKETFLEQLVRFSQALGFDKVSAMVVVEGPLAQAEFIVVDNASPDFHEIADLSLSKIDPVMQHCKTRGVPLVWDQSTYVRAGCAEKWECQAKHGYGCGIAWAMHLPNGRHFAIGVDRDKALPRDQVELNRRVALLQMFGTYAQEAAASVLLPKGRYDDAPKLTRRELETLRWTLEGKTAWEISRIFSISENTVGRHAHNAAQKLGCTSKHHAAVIALRLGLIY